MYDEEATGNELARSMLELEYRSDPDHQLIRYLLFSSFGEKRPVDVVGGREFVCLFVCL